MTPDLSGQAAVVTGAASGIGLAAGTALGESGARLVLCDRDGPGLEAAAAALGAAGIACVALPGDVADPRFAEAAASRVLEEFESVEILVNAAGVIRDARVEKVLEADWDAVHAVNLKGPFLFCRAIVPELKARGYGRIVNVGSRAWLGGFGQASYAASKGGLVSLTRSLALELARDGITANTVAPGTIDTPMFRSFAPKVQERLRKGQPAGRLGTPQEVAATIRFLASPEASFITGQTLHVCGGRSLVAAEPGLA
jgi:3-oxoacyl-[acyl-carrier protein] reductase